MSQFSIPLGIITASVIGGAVYLNHATTEPGKDNATAQPAASTAPAVVANAAPGESATTAPAPSASVETKSPPVKLARLETPAPVRARPSSASAPATRSMEAQPTVSVPAPPSAPVETAMPAESPAKSAPSETPTVSAPTPAAEPAATTSKPTE